jgi:hypothetical protein
MTDPQHGPNVRRVAYVDHVTDLTIRISEGPDGWQAIASTRRYLTNLIVTGEPTAEAAAAAILKKLEEAGEDVPEPPEDWWSNV